MLHDLIASIRTAAREFRRLRYLRRRRADLHANLPF